jgi:PAS domain S-box-containing protein
MTDEQAIVDDPAALYRLIADSIPHMVWTSRPDGTSEFYNGRFLEYTGMSVEALAGWAWKVIVHPDERERCIAAWTRALQTGERYDVEYRLRRADGTYRWHHGTAVPQHDARGRIVRWFGACTDIEPEVRSAQILEGMVEERTRALRDSEASVRTLMDRLIAAQESERRRVAGELHDLIGQNLTALGIDLAALDQWLAAQDASWPASGPVTRLEDMRSLLERTIGQIRGVMSALRPPELEEYGLVAALRCHVDEFSARTGLRATLEVTGSAARLEPDAELALFRIVQEALVNAAKHSGGSAVRVAVAHEPGAIRASVTDDGRGVPSGRNARGWGLKIMHERAAAFGAKLAVEPAAPGTRVTVEVPFEARRRGD